MKKKKKNFCDFDLQAIIRVEPNRIESFEFLFGFECYLPPSLSLYPDLKLFKRTNFYSKTIFYIHSIVIAVAVAIAFLFVFLYPFDRSVLFASFKKIKFAFLSTYRKFAMPI